MITSRQQFKDSKKLAESLETYIYLIDWEMRSARVNDEDIQRALGPLESFKRGVEEEVAAYEAYLEEV